MKHFLLSLLIISCANLTCAQTCYVDKYPFFETITIKLVSFSNMDSTLPYWKSKSGIILPILEGGNIYDVDFTKLDRIKPLNIQQSVILSRILFTDTSTCTENPPTDCSDIKSGHAILFINDENQVFERVDFCFDCGIWSGDGKSYGLFCGEKIKLIKDFFVANGF